MNNLSIFKNLNWKLNFPILFLMGAGLLSLASTSLNLFYKQIGWIFLGIIIAALFIKIDWRSFVNQKGLIWGFYFLIFFILIATLFFAPTIKGNRSWLVLGPLQFQPAEFAKLALILIYSAFFSRKHAAIARISNLLVSFVYFLIPGLLIALQPDFGSALVLFFIWLGFLFVSGIKWRHLLIVIFIFLISGVFMWFGILKDYQKERILGFISPGRDPLGINYSVIQSRVAIGSAGLFGKGFKQGTQAQLGFLPEKGTDFIFPAFTEEWGIIAGFLVIAAFIFIIFQIMKIGLGANNNFNRFVCLGAVILFLSQFILNIGSALGLTPVIGVTFPFFSYGGSSLLTNLSLVGIIQSIFRHRSL
ncbi:rod shape-determining protein RodA [Candidatus Wolfebacteria bacterium]|nr:rod shape-determining protein RodA [Candidatus Wolfebacteria bacterium]